jgi:CRISPR/Cas system CSM-associated protein Csm4 (group 5 of RAMP superfamily)
VPSASSPWSASVSIDSVGRISSEEELHDSTQFGFVESRGVGFLAHFSTSSLGFRSRLLCSLNY